MPPALAFCIVLCVCPHVAETYSFLTRRLIDHVMPSALSFCFVLCVSARGEIPVGLSHASVNTPCNASGINQRKAENSELRGKNSKVKGENHVIYILSQT